MKKVALLLADGFEEAEALVTCDILRRANLNCDLVSINQIKVIGGHNIEVTCDKIINDEIKEYDMLIIPGGMIGVNNLRNNEKVLELTKHFIQPTKYLASICAGPLVIMEAGVGKGKKITAYPSIDITNQLKEYQLSTEKLVIDNNLITANAAGAVFEFALALVEVLTSNSKQIKQAIHLN